MGGVGSRRGERQSGLMRVRLQSSYLSSQADEANLVDSLPEPMRIEATDGLDEKKAFPALNYRQ